MEQAVKSHPAAVPGIDQVKADLAALQRDVAALVAGLKTAAVDGTDAAVRASADRLGDGVRALYDELAAQGERSASAVGRQLQAQPVLSLLLAFGVGFCASRLLSR